MLVLPARVQAAEPERNRTLDATAWTLVLLGATAAAAATAFALHASADHDSWTSSTDRFTKPVVKARAEERVLTTDALAGLSVASFAAGGIILLTF